MAFNYHSHAYSNTDSNVFIFQPTRPEACALSQREHEEEFWDKDMADMLRQDLPLRQELGKYFEKNTGSESKE